MRPSARCLFRAFAAWLVCAVAGYVPAHAQTRGDLIGITKIRVAEESDTLPDLALANGLGYVEIVAANPGVDPWLPGAGTVVVLPTAHILPAAPRRGIVINLADQRLYYFPPSESPLSFPLGVPSAEVELRLGQTTVIAKRADPVWVPPPSVRTEDPDLPASVPPGPDNPLGAFALDLGWPSHVVHGTNRPYGIGRRVSHGCFRLYPEDIERLFKLVPVGTPVMVVDQPAKAGWHQGELYLEVHPGLEQADRLEESGSFADAPVANLHRLVRDAAGPLTFMIDWGIVDRTASERRGVPVRVLK